jgi:ABC-type nitrate/sulfonate/bicarbonate transport system substrate-binding protein
MKKGFTCLLGLLSAVHWFSSPAWAQVAKLKAAYSAESSWSLATWVANDAGLYKKYGLDVD